MKRGFTLVELSIVLVIIGLFISGILIGQSMIQTAKIETFIRQLQQIDAAVSNFQTKYNGLPGDSLFFGGNGDGMITDATPTSGGSASFTGETANFWISLQQGGFDYRGKTFTATVPASGLDINSITPNTPKLSLDADVGIVVTYAPNVIVPGSSNFYGLGNWQGNNISTGGAGHDIQSNGKIVTPANAQAIDTKIDDGRAFYGNVTIAPTIVSSGTFDVGGAYNTCATSAGGPYDLTNKTIGCSLSVRVLSQVGQSQ